MLFLLFPAFVLLVKGAFGETVNANKGQSVILQTGLAQIQSNDVLEWRFGAGKDLLARFNKAAGKPPRYEDGPGGNFRDRLRLDEKTGSLTIMNAATTDSGDYEVATSIVAFQKTLKLSVSDSDPGLSAGAITGIVLSVVAVIAGVVSGAIYFTKKGQVL